MCAHNLCLFEDLPTDIQQGEDRQIDILERRAERGHYSISYRKKGRAGNGLQLTCRNEI
jgi:hypothetical protein